MVKLVWPCKLLCASDWFYVFVLYLFIFITFILPCIRACGRYCIYAVTFQISPPPPPPRLPLSLPTLSGMTWYAWFSRIAPGKLLHTYYACSRLAGGNDYIHRGTAQGRSPRHCTISQINTLMQTTLHFQTRLHPDSHASSNRELAQSIDIITPTSRLEKLAQINRPSR